MNRFVASLLLLLCANYLAAPASAWEITIDTVPVGNAGNAPDTVIMADGTTGYGSVDYEYQIGKYEVTNAEYAAFLNAKAKNDPLGLYQGGMASLGHPEWGGITRSGADGSFTYALIPGRENKPVALVNWYDAARFANWLHNGQGNGDTETGAYTILGGTPLPSNGPSIIRNPGATWFLPSENEWYKAAFYNPDTSSYFVFPTSSDTPPTAEAPAGGSNSANHNQGYAGDFTDVGAYAGTKSPYGAFDMAGNAWEWNEAVFAGGWRGLRGTSFLDISPAFLLSSFRGSAVEWGENGHVGFRVATIPEPSTLALTGIGLAAVLARSVARRRPRRLSALMVASLALFTHLAIPVAGGHVANAEQFETRVDIYNAATDTWSTGELSEARRNLAATSAGGKALFAGGYNGGVSNRVDLFEATTGQWTTTSLSQPRMELAATAVGDLALFGGGFDPSWQSASRVDIYDAAKDQWSQSELSVARGWPVATTVGNRAFFAGGITGEGYASTSVVDIYDASTGQWAVAHLSQARGFMAATTAGDRAFFAGGYSGQNGISDVVDIYDAKTDQWSVAHLSQPRGDGVAAAVGSKVFFAGGASAVDGTASAVVDVFDTDTAQWSTASLSQARYALAATVLDNRAYFAGGSSTNDGTTGYDIVDIYDGNTGLWSVDHLSIGRSYLSGTSLGELVLFGGGSSPRPVPEPVSLELAAAALLGVLGFVGVRRWRRQTPALLAAMVIASLLVPAPSARADIFRWDNSQVIPGTEGITPGPGVQLIAWNSDGHNLRYADFSGGVDLSGSWFDRSWLDNARFTEANLTGAHFEAAALAAADLRGAVVKGASLADITSRGFTQDQLKSTASYQAKDLQGVELWYNDMTGWDFSGQNLTDARLWQSTLTAADLSGAVVTGASFGATTSRGLTQDQLKSTASYQAKDLQGVELWDNDLTGWDFSGQNLTDARLWQSTLAAADLSGAVVTGANFGATTSRGFTQDQLKSTASYQAKDLQGILLWGNDLTGWDLSGQNLTHASLFQSTLTGADFSGAVIHWTSFDAYEATPSFTQDQLKSTASYHAKDLQGIGLTYNDLSGWDFSGQNLTNANLYVATLNGANFSGAVVTGVNFQYTTPLGFTQAQLVSTASYQEKELHVILGTNDLTGWDFSGQNLSDAILGQSTLTDADFSGADTRAVQDLDLTKAISRNTILPNGSIQGLDLSAGDRLVVRDDDGVPASPPIWWMSPRPSIEVTVQDHLAMADGGALELRFDADPWNSLISFAPGIPVQLGGALELTFAQGADAAPQVGHTLHVFDWSGVSPSGAFTVLSLYDWDTSGLYTTGVVTLLAAGGAIAGDANGDGKVEMVDFDILKTHFGDPGTKSEGDANGDGRIDLNDFGLLKLNFGKSAASVPEPASIVLAVLGLTLVHLRRRLRRPS